MIHKHKKVPLQQIAVFKIAHTFYTARVIGNATNKLYECDFVTAYKDGLDNMSKSASVHKFNPSNHYYFHIKEYVGQFHHITK